MIFHRLGLINKNQRGFTLIEVMIAIAITGIITGGITTAIFQVFDGSTRSSNHMTAVRQVQNAGYWVSHDGQMAQSVELGASSGFPLTLTWTDWETGDVYEVVYNTLLVDNELQRSYSINGVANGTTIVAEFIDPAMTEFTAGGAFSLPDIGDAFTITDAVGGDSGTITVTAGNISVAPTGTATYNAGTGVWATPSADDAVVVAADLASTQGDWTATTGTATAAITEDVGDVNATVAAGGVLIFTVTATVGTGSREQSETRVYEIVPRPGS